MARPGYSSPNSAMSLPACYALSSTDTAYGATRWATPRGCSGTVSRTMGIPASLPHRPTRCGVLTYRPTAFPILT
eukprot:1978986-Rhodomonas_salina.1